METVRWGVLLEQGGDVHQFRDDLCFVTAYNDNQLDVNIK